MTALAGDPPPRAIPPAAVAVAVVALLAFVPVLHGGFVYDDHRFLAGNPHLGAPSVLWRAFADPSCQTADGTHAGLWRPLRTLSFALDRALFGGSPAGPHAVSVVVHAAGSGALTALLLAWRVPPAGAVAGALVYALHPAQAECVAWISSRGDVLAAGCLWASLVLDLRGRSGPAFALGCAALLSKGEQAVVWPALLVLSRAAAGRGFRASLRGAWAPAAASAAFVALRALVLDVATQEGGLGHGPAGGAVLGSILAHQAWTAVLPVRLVFDWQMPWTTSAPWPVACTAAGIAAGLVFRPTRIPVAWFLAALAPTWLAQAVVPLNILTADRFLLFALPALALGVGRAAAAHRGTIPAAGLAAVCLGAATVGSLGVWRDDASLWGRTAALVPGHWRANAWLGADALRAGRFEDAEQRLSEAAVNGPDDARTRFQLAQAQEVIGTRRRDDLRMTAALGNYRAAIGLCARPRAEGAASVLPLARWAEADLTLLTGDAAAARERFETLLAEPPPALDDEGRRALAARTDVAARRAEAGLGADVAARIRAWGGRP